MSAHNSEITVVKQKSVGKEVLVSILAASTALGFGVAVVDGAFANPIDDAKAKTSTSLKSAQDAAPSLPSAPSPGGAVKDAQKSAEKLTSDVSGQIDGIFGKGKVCRHFRVLSASFLLYSQLYCWCCFSFRVRNRH